MQHSLTPAFQYSFLGAVVVSACLLLSGCASKHPSAQSNPATKQNEVQRRLAEILDAAEEADLPRLDSYHWYGPHFTKFASIGKRMDAATAREGEHKGLSTGARLKLYADELQVDVFNDVAVATFMMIATIQSSGNTVTKRERGTLVFARNAGSWKIVHEHFSAAD